MKFLCYLNLVFQKELGFLLFHCVLSPNTRQSSLLLKHSVLSYDKDLIQNKTPRKHNICTVLLIALYLIPKEDARSGLSFTGNLLEHFLRTFLVDTFPFLKRNCSENVSFVEILIQEKKTGMFNLSCFNTYKNWKQLYLSKFELSYTMRSGKQKRRSKLNNFFIDLI